MKTLVKYTVFLLSVFVGAYNASSQVTTKVIVTGGYATVALKKAIEKNVSEVLNGLALAYENDESSLVFKPSVISESATANINDIWSATKLYCMQDEIKELLIKTSNGFQLRNIKVLTEEGDEQEIVVELDKKGMVSDLYFSLNLHQYKNVMNANGVVDITRREIILNFMEMLKTAYMKKDINFIDDVFSEKALIIVGKTIQKTNKSAMTLITNKETFARQSSDDTEYKKLTKQEYLTGLRRVFANNKSIRLKFEDIEVERHEKKGYESFYGVRLKQQWKADAYSDYGVLFFLIQFRENDHPLIWVRTWQDANTTGKSEEIGFGDFRIKPE